MGMATGIVEHAAWKAAVQSAGNAGFQPARRDVPLGSVHVIVDPAALKAAVPGFFNLEIRVDTVLMNLLAI